MFDLTEYINIIWEQDTDLQLECLHTLSQEIRGVSSEEIISKDVEYWRNIGMFYVPDELYLVDRLGDRIVSYKYGVYRDQFCTLAGRIAIPLRVLTGGVIGFVGYSNSIENAGLYDDPVLIKYLFPPDYILQKSRFIFCEPDWFEAALRDQYVCITDGVFDAIRLNQYGIHAVSLCGSNLSAWHKMYLGFIRNIVVVADNDNAGVRLAQQCLNSFKYCSWLKFDATKDIDDFLKDPIRLLKVKRIFDKKSFLFFSSDLFSVVPHGGEELQDEIRKNVEGFRYSCDSLDEIERSKQAFQRVMARGMQSEEAY